MLLLTQQEALRTAAMSTLPYSPGLEAAYKFKTNFDEDVNMSIKVGNTLLVPRRTCPVSKTNDCRVSYDPVAIDCKFTPRDEEQATLIPKSAALLKSGQDHIFDAPTGWGKTVAGVMIAVALGQPTIIVVTKEDLMEQWYDTIVNVLKINPNLVGKIQQDTCVWHGKMIVVAMVHSLVIPDRYDPAMYKYFGLAILDEVHLMAADTFIRACQMLPARYRLGFSATAERRDGKTRVLYAHVGPVLVKGTLVPMKAKIIVHNTGWAIPVTSKGQQIPHSPGRMALVTKAMASSPARNAKLTNFAVQSYKADRRILVLSDLIDHLNTLHHCFNAAGIPAIDMAYYIGGMKKHDLEMSKKVKVVLATYAMCSTGTNVPEWNTLILASPRATVKQAMGRVTRMVAGKKQPVIFDPVDYNKIFNKYYLSRLKEYYSVGSIIVNM